MPSVAPTPIKATYTAETADTMETPYEHAGAPVSPVSPVSPRAGALCPMQKHIRISHVYSVGTMPSVAPTPIKATPKAPVSYLDMLPTDIIEMIYEQVIADTLTDMEAQVEALETSIINVKPELFTSITRYTPYMHRMLTLNTDDITQAHPVYDGFLHIHPDINLHRVINARNVEISVWNVWQLTLHDEDSGLAGYMPPHITFEISLGYLSEPLTNFTVIDEIMRYALGFGLTLHNPGWRSNCVDDIRVILPYDGDDDDDMTLRVHRATNADYTAQGDETVKIWVNLWHDLDGVGYDQTHEYSRVTLFEDEE